ncbi:MAG: cysteine desulfurase family protein [bacterium]|nr:cysteine desulfurase family protein [bacterium]
MKQLYLDNAAATPIDPKVRRVIELCDKKIFANASSPHSAGREARNIIEDSRKTAAKIISASPEEIIFTGSGTEANNLALLGIARANKKYGKHIITTVIEHHSVLNSCEALKKEGFKITYLKVGKNGIISPEDLKKALRKDTILFSVMYVNNEIGTIQPIQKISKILHNFRDRPSTIDNRLLARGRLPLFHTDAIQAAEYLDLNVQKLGVDLMSLNGSKIYGPKSIGCLFVRRGVNIEPIMLGGSQERGLRPGTENPTLVAGFSKALELAEEKKNKESKRLAGLRDYVISKILKEIPDSYLNGDAGNRLPNNINISFSGIDGEALVLALDQEGIYVSTGSACTTSETGPSHVLKALGNKKADNLRITLGRFTTKKETDYFLKILPGAVKKIRKIYL